MSLLEKIGKKNPQTEKEKSSQPQAGQAICKERQFSSDENGFFADDLSRCFFFFFDFSLPQRTCCVCREMVTSCVRVSTCTPRRNCFTPVALLVVPFLCHVEYRSLQIEPRESRKIPFQKYLYSTKWRETRKYPWQTRY